MRHLRGSKRAEEPLVGRCTAEVMRLAPTQRTRQWLCGREEGDQARLLRRGRPRALFEACHVVQESASQLPRLVVVAVRLGGPEEPGDDHGKLEGSGHPEGAADAEGAVRQEAASDGAGEKQHGRGGAAVALDVGEGEEVVVGEEVAVDAGEDDAGQGVVAQGSAGDGLGTALEGDEGEGQQHGPVDGVIARGRGEGDDEGGGDGQGRLGGEGGAEDPAAAG